ncbi:MAG: glycosyltransferase [Anaerolineales bacterium]|nr:glycosyltransferase [Anaerolineales bacterium]
MSVLMETGILSLDLHQIPLKAEVCPDIVFVILARNEAGILAETLLDLQTYLGRFESIHIVADNCEDETAQIAGQAGVVVWEREGGNASGKGAALGWWLEQTADQDPDQIVVVLDADSRLTAEFIPGLYRWFADGVQALQARILPSLERDTPSALLSALSELSEQYVDDVVRSRAGWGVRLRGTGMAFKRSVLARFGGSLHTLVEDVELSLLLAAEGVRVQSAPDLVLLDPKPTSGTGVMRQRARWLRGQAQVLKEYRAEIGKILRKGPAGWSLLVSLLLKPKSLVWFSAFAASLLLYGLSSLLEIQTGAVLLFWFSSIYAMMVGTKILYTVSRIPERRQVRKALLYTPAFMILWFFSFLLAVVSGNTWLRSRPRMDPTRIG